MSRLDIGVPVGLFGDAMKTTFVRLSTESSTALMSTVKSSLLGIFTITPQADCVATEYKPKVGPQLIARSPGSITRRRTRSMSSSLPEPATMCSFGRPVYRASSSRSLSASGSG